MMVMLFRLKRLIGPLLSRKSLAGSHLKKEVVSSLVFQFFTNAVGLLVVPLTLGYISSEKYGIWVTATSLVVWLQNMNFGMGYGMQNKVTEALANNNKPLAKMYVTVVYKYTLLIGAAILLFCFPVIFLVNLNQLFNSKLPVADLRAIAVVTFVSFSLYFIASNLNPLLTAVKQTSLTKLLGLTTNISIVIVLYVVRFFSHDSIFLASIALSGPLPIIYVIATLIFFNKNRDLSPDFRLPTKEHFKDVFTVGGKFLIMQLTSLVMFFTGSLIITQYLGPQEVTPFNVISKYFYFPLFIFSLGIAPVWPAFTEAYTRKEFNWISSIIKKLLTIAAVACMATTALFIAGFYIIPIWSRNSFDISEYKSMMWLFLFYTVIMFFSSIVSTFLNALSILNYQVKVQVISAILYLVVSIGLIKYAHFGGASVVAGMAAAMLFYTVLCGWAMFRQLQKQQVP
jgi:O-antigen/teichoic acid export membrane protein